MMNDYYQYTLTTMTFYSSGTECTLQHITTAKELTIPLAQLAAQGQLLKQLNKGSLAAVLYQLEQETSDLQLKH
ncbi:hypothetical protein PsalN5692_00234 [Piscirickettsia salmonis]|nr:hypothetical protein PsalN5692_00234 [Piscirickettsia salmonis]